MDPIEEIKSKIDIVDFIGEYVKLRPVGKNYQGLCPFHKDTHPSFYVSPERQVWKCFGCERGGDIFSFLQEIEGIEFPEALRILAKRAGVKLGTFQKHEADERLRLIEICRLSALFYHQVLLRSPLAKEARSYLKKRGLKDEIIEEFKLGFAPERWDSLLKFLTKRKYALSDIEAAGLIVSGKRASQYYDRFRDRIMFPICNSYGEVVGFTGRVLPGADEKQGKYINTPQTAIYNKSRILYGLNLAKPFIRQEDSVVLVEGNMDVISSYQAGVKNVVCSSGTALTESQIELLSRYSKNVILAFDVDPAGMSATNRSIDLMLSHGLNIKIVNLPKGKDPDDCIRQNPLFWKNAVAKPLAFMDYYFSQVLKRKKIETLEDKRKAGKELLEVISKIKDSFERDLWIQKLANALKVSEESLQQAMAQLTVSRKAQVSPAKTKEETETKEIERTFFPEEEAGKRFLGLVAGYPQLAKNISFLNLDILPTHDLRTIARIIKKCWQTNKRIESKRVEKELKERRLVNFFNLILFLAEKEYQKFNPEDLEKECQRLLHYLKDRYLKAKIEEKTLELEEIEKTGKKKQIEALTRQILRLTEIREKIKNLK